MRIIILLFFLLLYHSSLSQSIVGLWIVDEVLVGQRVLTPVAKWFRINNDSTVQSGNGWTQNSIATWTYDSALRTFSPKNILTAPDPFGGFEVGFTGDQMVWRRIEEGDSVKVTLSPIPNLPMAPADSIGGSWKLTSARKGDQDITNIEELQSVNIRPDRLFNLTKSDGSRDFGIWHMDAHESKFFLISFDKAIEDRVFMVSFSEWELIMHPLQDDVTLIFAKQ